MNRLLPTLEDGVGTCEKMFSCTSFDQSADDVLQPLAKFMNAPTGLILRFQKNVFGEYPVAVARHKLPRKTTTAYKDAFFNTDPIAQVAFSQKATCHTEAKNSIAPLFRLVDQSKFLRSFYYNEFLRAHGLGDVLAMFIEVDNVPDDLFCVAVQRWSDLPRFGMEDITAFHQLYPLLSTCLNNISLRETAHLMETSTSKQNLVGHNVGISTWDENFRLIHASPSALSDLDFSQSDKRLQWVEWFRSVAKTFPADALGLIFDGYFDGLHISIEHSQVDGCSRYTIISTTPDFNNAISQWAGRSHLTIREQEVCRYITSGLTNESAAYQMNISIKTVQNHTISIYAKLGVNSRSQLVARLMGWELTDYAKLSK